MFTAGLDEDDKKDGLFKRLKNISSSRLKNIIPTHGLNLDNFLLSKDRFQIQKLYNKYSSLQSIEDKFSFINKFYDKIKDFKNRDVLSDNIDKKNRILGVTIRVNILKTLKTMTKSSKKTMTTKI